MTTTPTPRRTAGRATLLLAPSLSFAGRAGAETRGAPPGASAVTHVTPP